MIKNWATIETIAIKIKKLRATAAQHKRIDKTSNYSKLLEATARKWEALLRKFADSCLMVEIFQVTMYSPGNRETYLAWRFAISPEVAIEIVKRECPSFENYSAAPC